VLERRVSLPSRRTRTPRLSINARLSTKCYFSTRENSPVDAFTATRILAVSRSVP